MSSSRLAPVQLIAWTLSSRIICARESPSSAVLIAPASVTSIAPPESRWALYASDASTRLAALKWREWCRRYSLTGPDFRVTVSLICLRSEEQAAELQSRGLLVCRLLVEIRKSNISQSQTNIDD